MGTIKVIIADDIMILRQGLKAVLEQDSDINVIGLAQNGKEAYDQCKSLHPDIVLMDMRMPEYDGAFGIQAIKKDFPDIRVLVLTTFDDDKTIEKAIESGADGYILKEMEDAKVIASVKSVHAGMSIFGDGVYKVMRKKMNHSTDVSVEDDTSLTPRERDIIRLVAQGHDNKQISSELFLAEGTVRNLVSRLLEKLELKDRTQLAVYAVKHGLDE